MPEFSSSKIILHRFHIDNNGGKPGIGYDTIIARNLMLQLGIFSEFKRRFFQGNGATAPMKEPRSLLGKIDLTSYEMREVVMKA